MAAAADLQIPRDIAQAVVQEAGRAPSIHNTQPGQWRLAEDGVLELWGDPSRALAIADPLRRDNDVSLGAAIEGARLALAKRGINVEIARTPTQKRPPARLYQVARLTRLGTPPEPDDLAEMVSIRHTYRGKLLPAPSEVANLAHIVSTEPLVQLIKGRTEISYWARRYDDANLVFRRQPAYCEEYYKWLRFDRLHPGYHRDGLNAECCSLSPAAARTAKVMLKPGYFRVAAALGMGRLIAGERAKIVSASCLVAFFAPQGEDPLVTGENFYRLWLTITRCGLAACPLAALADHQPTALAIKQALQVPQDFRLINVFRCGLAPKDGVPVSPRLPLAEVFKVERGSA